MKSNIALGKKKAELVRGRPNDADSILEAAVGLQALIRDSRPSDCGRLIIPSTRPSPIRSLP